jgi:hypothetical protein
VHLDVDGHDHYAKYLFGRVREHSHRWRAFAGAGP